MANLIDGSFNTASETIPPGADVTGAALSLYFPKAKFGNGNYIYVFGSTGALSPDAAGSGIGAITGFGPYYSLNYFGISVVTIIYAGFPSPGMISSQGGIRVQQAYNIDQKIDDGLPMSGSVVAAYLNNFSVGCGGGCGIAASLTTCWDNNNILGGTLHYSTQISQGAGANCGLSFRF